MTGSEVRVVKIGRNDPCPCRSGRKFKHCCLDTNRNDKSLLRSGVEEVHEALDQRGGKPPGEAAQCEADATSSRHCSKVLRTPSGVTRWRGSSRPMICNGWGKNSGWRGPAGPGGRETPGGFAQELAEQIAGGAASLTPRLSRFLADHIDSLLDFFDGFVKAADAGSIAAENLANAYLLLLQQQLTNLRYSIERNYDWAKRMLDSFQERLIGAIRSGEVTGPQIVAIASAMSEAKLQPSDNLVAACEERLGLEADACAAGIDPASVADQIVREHGSDPFDIYEALFAVSHIGSIEFRAAGLQLMISAPAAPMREAAALAVLNPHPAVRREVALALLQHCHDLTPAVLRRLIVIRNWLPEDERHLIDQVIKAARLAGVECATWMPMPGGANGEIQASVIDGAGAQATMIVTHAGRKHRLSGVLFKQGVGVADAWTLEPESKRHIGRTLKEMTDSEARLMPVTRTYLDLAVAHHLRTGLERRMPPPARLLQVAETIKASQWQPASAGWQEMLRGLVAEMPRELLSPTSVRAILASSAQWAMQGGWADSWIEQDQEVTDLLDSLSGRPRHAVRDAVLTGIIEKRRAIWAERLVLTALWMKEAISATHLPWERFAIVAQKLLEEVPLREIPLMKEIAELSASL
jgi:SEC-C motif